MVSMESITQKISQKKTRLQDLGIKEIGLFGSYVRGEETDSSDLDILIDIERPAKLDLLALISLEQELSDDLGVTVDLVLKSDLRPILGKNVLSEVIYL
jgi:predicted nucleotidyltransferase